MNRAYSHYQMNTKNGFEDLLFEECIKRCCEKYPLSVKKLQNFKYRHVLFYPKYSYLVRGIYIDQVKRWFCYFPKNQILIIRIEDFNRNCQKIMTKVFKFLRLIPY